MKIRFKAVILFLLTLILFIGGMLMLNNNPHHNSYKLVSAIYSNNMDKVREIINKHPNSVNSVPSIMPRWWNVLVENRNFFPLQEACYKGNVDMVNRLLEAGADVNAIDPYIGSTPLLMALSSGAVSESRFDIAVLLVEHGADINAVTKNRPGDSVISKSVLIRDSDSTIIKQRGYQLFDYLFANCQLTNINWVSVLMDSAYFGNINAVNKLINSGIVDINSTNSLGQTALINATLSKSKAMVSFLLEKGADKSIKDDEGKTAYDHAIESSNLEIVKLLKDW